MAPGPRLQELTAKYMQNPRRYFVPLANEYRKANELDRAIALCREHLSSQPGHMSGHIVLARAYFEKGDIEAAREVFLTSVALDDENLIALRHLGDISRARNDLVDARQWYTRVLDADPQNEEIERLLRTLGQPESNAAATSTPDEQSTVIAVPASPTVPDHPELSVPASSPPEPQLSALDDPTPPGLRAIVTPGYGSSVPATPALPPVPVRTLNTFDLSTLDAPPVNATTPSDGIRVDDGVGFIFDDLEELTDPSAASAPALSLPPAGDADFSAGIETPATSTGAIPPASDDPLLSRPGFGALASFASWRTAQDRETPSQAAPRVTPSAPPPVTPLAVPAVEDEGMFWASPSADTAPTAPEFVTETMAALYAQQGFTQQALDVYRALLSRTSGDSGLTAKVAELEGLLSSDGVDKALRDDADKALQFDDLDAAPDGLGESRSALEDMYAASPPASDTTGFDATFGGSWTAEKDAVGDDWFAEAGSVDSAAETGSASDGIFGVTSDAFGQPAVPSFGRESAGASGSTRPTASIEMVFGATTTIAPADEAAADMLLALAGQMVGRLPKDAPTLPVPDILELPSAVAGDEAAGASPAPLLSFDRFFSGSGSPPRQRIDTPAGRSATPTWPAPPPAPPPPSLSPTFGGVPVIPPPPASVTPSSWATFDQFVPPAQSPPSVVPTSPAAPAAIPQPSVPPPVASPAPMRPLSPPVPVKPKSLPPTQQPYAAFTGLPSELMLPSPAPGTVNLPTAPKADAPDNAAPDADRDAPSEFHKWLEGLS